MFLSFGTETRHDFVRKGQRQSSRRRATLDSRGANTHSCMKECTLVFSHKTTAKCFLYPEKEKYLTEDEAAAVLTYQYKTDKTLPSTHQAMPVNAGKTRKHTGTDERKFNATRGQCGHLTVTVSQWNFNLLFKKTLHLTINGLLYSRIREISEKRDNSRQISFCLWKTLICT